MVIDQQISFEGHVIQAFEADVPGLGKMPLGELGLEKRPEEGDEIEVKMRLKVGHSVIGARYDKADGTAKSQYQRTYTLVAIRPGFEVLAYVTKAELDAAWNTSHGATG